jgi:hypothetical protein
VKNADYILSSIPEKDLHPIALMYVNLYLETGDIGFAAIADGIFTELAEREDNEISNYIEKRGKDHGKTI